MFEYDSCYRFVIESEEDLKSFISSYEKYVHCTESFQYSNSANSTGKRGNIDPTPLEYFFENVFEVVYGRSALTYLIREYEVADIDGAQRFYDYVLFTNQKMIVIEENGIKYHHPGNIGKIRYIDQLKKQNSIVAFGGKVYRWSSEDINFTDRIADDIRKYLGPKDNFIEQAKYINNREVTLYEHQEDILSQISADRISGNTTFLIHLPTGTGKTKIIEEDLKNLFRQYPDITVCILTPTSNLQNQWISVLLDIFPDRVGKDNKYQIFVTTYAYMYMNYYRFDSNFFNYMVVDEAHHSPAIALSKVIKHFNPRTLIGLTATDERYDKKTLQKIYGEYEDRLTLKEAIEKGILCRIRCFRIKSNIDLSEVRFNGKDYYASDLEKAIRVESRNSLIVATISKYFGENSGLSDKSGLVFCVNVAHAKLMSGLLNEQGISSKAVYGSNKKSQEYIDDYLNGNIRFLCACNLITEGWDAPRTSVIVMARPTMSKVLYLQQLGRGTRKYPGKEALYVLDVVDNYGAYNSPWSVHGIFGISGYIAFNDILVDQRETSSEMEILDGLFEYEREFKEIDVFTFEQKYGDYLNTDQLARELFVSEGTVKSWIRKSEIDPDAQINIGSRVLHLFHPDSVTKIRQLKSLPEHSEDTIYDDFMEFIEAKDYTFSYKIAFMQGFLNHLDENGEADINDVLDSYQKFYLDRHSKGLTVDRSNSPYNDLEFIKDRKLLKASMLENPFEKFERKRFIYYSKELSKITYSPYLFTSFSKDDLADLAEFYKKEEVEYYKK